MLGPKCCMCPAPALLYLTHFSHESLCPVIYKYSEEGQGKRWSGTPETRIIRASRWCFSTLLHTSSWAYICRTHLAPQSVPPPLSHALPVYVREACFALTSILQLPALSYLKLIASPSSMDSRQNPNPFPTAELRHCTAVNKGTMSVLGRNDKLIRDLSEKWSFTVTNTDLSCFIYIRLREKK